MNIEQIARTLKEINKQPEGILIYLNIGSNPAIPTKTPLALQVIHSGTDNPKHDSLIKIYNSTSATYTTPRQIHSIGGSMPIKENKEAKTKCY